MEERPFRIKRNCLSCKHHSDDCSCKKDGSDTSKWLMNELKCCELSESARQLETEMNAIVI